MRHGGRLEECVDTRGVGECACAGGWVEVVEGSLPGARIIAAARAASAMHMAEVAAGLGWSGGGARIEGRSGAADERENGSPVG